MLRIVPSHLIWCDAEGTPPVNMSLFNSSTLLATGEGKVASQIIQEGNYTCIATNKFGTDSRDFQVTFTGNIYKFHALLPKPSHLCFAFLWFVTSQLKNITKLF